MCQLEDFLSILHVNELHVLHVDAWLMSCMLLLQLRCCQAGVMQSVCN